MSWSPPGHWRSRPGQRPRTTRRCPSPAASGRRSGLPTPRRGPGWRPCRWPTAGPRSAGGTSPEWRRRTTAPRRRACAWSVRASPGPGPDPFPVGRGGRAAPTVPGGRCRRLSPPLPPVHPPPPGTGWRTGRGEAVSLPRPPRTACPCVTGRPTTAARANANRSWRSLPTAWAPISLWSTFWSSWRTPAAARLPYDGWGSV